MGKATTRAQNKYIAKAYDRINFLVPKGRKEIIKQAAQESGRSLNAFISEAVDEKMERDKDT